VRQVQRLKQREESTERGAKRGEYIKVSTKRGAHFMKESMCINFKNMIKGSREVSM
jgi:hypothetical protein